MIVIAFVGVFVTANLIGIVSGAFDAKVAELRKGRSTVLETGHTVILGWNSKMTTIVQELAAANASAQARRHRHPRRARQGRDGGRDPLAHPEARARQRSSADRGARSTRTTSSSSNPFRAKAVIILSDETGDDPDSRTIKTALALTRHPKRDGGPLHIVGQIHDSENLEVAKIVGGDEATWILGSEKVGQITAQTSRQPGLTAVYQDLLDFGGVEIYFTTQAALVGQTFYDAQLSFARRPPIGFLREGAVILNPAGDEKIARGRPAHRRRGGRLDHRRRRQGRSRPKAIAKGKRTVSKPEKTLILGSNQSLPHILRELDGYARQGSTVAVVSEFKVGDLRRYKNLAVTVAKGSSTARAAIEALKPASFDHVIVASYRDNLGVQEADTKTLVTLLHLRDI